MELTGGGWRERTNPTKEDFCLFLEVQCCFYANDSGVVGNCMAFLRKRLNDRQLEKQSNEGRNESLFNRSLWLITMVFVLAGPLVLLLLALLCGRCIISALVRFVKEWISTVQLMV